MCVLSNTDFSRWWLSLAPLAFASILGSIAFALGLCSLRSVKLGIDSGTRNKLEVFVLRMLGFSICVLTPQLTQICLQFYEASKQPAWETTYYTENCDDLFVPCRATVTTEKPSVAFICAKYIILLSPALAPLTWIANSKFFVLSFLQFDLINHLEKTLRGWGLSSGSSTMTSSSCVKSQLEDKSEKSSLDDSRHDACIEEHLLPPPHELLNYKV